MSIVIDVDNLFRKVFCLCGWQYGTNRLAESFRHGMCMQERLRPRESHS